MNSKVIFKLVGLLSFLIVVLAAMGYMKSNEFKQTINVLLGLDGPKGYAWCPAHAIDFDWSWPKAQQKYKDLSPDKMVQKFCTLTLEPIVGVDLGQVQFKTLLKVQSAEAKTAVLEWSEEAKVFQVNGLPFSSTYLRRELLDEP